MLASQYKVREWPKFLLSEPDRLHSLPFQELLAPSKAALEEWRSRLSISTPLSRNLNGKFPVWHCVSSGPSHGPPHCRINRRRRTSFRDRSIKAVYAGITYAFAYYPDLLVQSLKDNEIAPFPITFPPSIFRSRNLLSAMAVYSASRHICTNQRALHAHT